MALVHFNSTSSDTASEEFLKWRVAHLRNGYYLNVSSVHGWVLHRAECPHAIMPDGSDMASRRKVCATSTAELRQWLKENNEGRAHRCNPCKPPVLPLALE